MTIQKPLSGAEQYEHTVEFRLINKSPGSYPGCIRLYVHAPSLRDHQLIIFNHRAVLLQRALEQLAQQLVS